MFMKFIQINFYNLIFLFKNKAEKDLG